MISLFKQFLIKLARDFLNEQGYEICLKRDKPGNKKQKWFWTKKLDEKEKLLLKQIFQR